MNLKYSTNKTPFIEFDTGAKLIFSSSTKDEDKGYRYLCFSHVETNTVCVSGSKAKKKKYANVAENINFTTTMNFTGIPNRAKEKVLTPITLSYLKKIFKDLTIDGYFPERNLDLLIDKLKIGDDTDGWDDDPTATESFDDDVKPVKKKLSRANGKPLKIKIKPKIKFNRKK